MLALLHIPSGSFIRFCHSTIKMPVTDLEFAYKFEFYRGLTKYPFKAWLEKTQAKIVANSVGNKESFYQANPFLKNVDVFLAEFEVVLVDESKGLPVFDLDISTIKAK